VKKLISLLFVVALLPACDQSPSEIKTPIAEAPTTAEIATSSEAEKKPASNSIFLLYKVEEPNTDPYESRIIITDEYIRLDDNSDGNDFVLVDRAKKIVYSVSDENDAILVVKHKPVTIKPPTELKFDTERTPDKDSPTIAGHGLVHYIFKVNGKACQDAMIAEGLLIKATNAISEYRQILAGQHAKTLNATPADLQNECDMAIHIFEPDQYLQFGLPIHERDHSGYQRSLLDYEDDFEPNPTLFVLPKEYKQYSIDELDSPTTDEAPVQS